MALFRPALRLAAPALLLAAALPSSAAARQEKPAAAPPDAVVQRILELQREIERLLASLPPELRAEVERRLAEGIAEPEPTPPVPRAAEPEVVEPETVEPVEAAPDPEEPEPGAPSAAGTSASHPVAPGPAADPPAASSCRPLALLDSDGDDQVSGADRYWRHLYLWADADGDGAIDEGEAPSLFELDVRSVSVELDRYTTDDDFVGDVALGDVAELRLVGRRRDADRRTLVIDADGLRRGHGPALVDARGEPVLGLQPLRRGWALVDEDGRRSGFPCDR
ncbi:MAG TPA: hypothetical protein VMV46_10800 [Thermoanaerobaculia bacterium]|nr:hypothetical protein [Thermoanaerobaculia bacterium]